MEDNFWQEEADATKAVLKYCPVEIQKFATCQIGKFVINDCTADELAVWDEMIASNPIVQRLIYYTYSPVDAYSARLDMLCVWSFQDPDSLVPREPALERFSLVDDIDRLHVLKKNDRLKNHEKLKNFISNLQDAAARVMYADIRKSAGAEGSIEELREKSCRIEYDAHGTPLKGVFDFSPFYRIEEFFNRKETHLYVLDDDPKSIEIAFSDVDHFLIGWYRMFHGIKKLSDGAFSDKTKVIIYDSHGNLLKPPENYNSNPFCFSLIPKYNPLIRKVVDERLNKEKKHKTIPVYENSKRGSRLGKEISDDLKSVFFELVTKYDPEKHGNFAGYLGNNLRSKIRDIRDRGFHRIDIKYGKKTKRYDETIYNKKGKEIGRQIDFEKTDIETGQTQYNLLHNKQVYEEWLSDPINKYIFELVLDNKNHTQIGSEIGISRQAVDKRLKHLEIKIRKADKIDLYSKLKVR